MMIDGLRIKISVLFALMICLGLPIMADVAKAEGPYTEGYFIYETDGDSAKITGYFGDEENVIVPDCLGGMNVKELAGPVFKQPNTRRVTLPESLLKVSDNSFEYAADLESVYLNSDVEISVPEHVLVIRNEAEYVDDKEPARKEEADIREIIESDDSCEINADDVLVTEIEYDDVLVVDPVPVQTSLMSIEENTVYKKDVSDSYMPGNKTASKADFGADLGNYFGGVLLIYGTIIVSLFGLFLVLFLFF